MSTRSRPQRADSVARIASLTIVNAMVFQEVLADHEARVQHLRRTLQAPDAVSAFVDHWQFILTINYHSIFHVGHQLLRDLPANPDVDAALRSLAHTALDIVRQRAALRHDLMGRVYHRLLADAKYLGTYYTSVPAATLLLKLAFNPDRWSKDWGDLGQLSFLRVGDLACGTGTLLMAAAEAITDNYLRACGEQHGTPHLDRLSRLLMEDTIYGCDVLPSALHLTASTLALRSPEVTFRAMNLWNLPFGGDHRRLGSIEFLRDFTPPITTDLFGASVAPRQVTATGDVSQQYARLPDLDLCVMNPPFTRSTGNNLLFGSLPDAERRPMQHELARLLRRRSIHASSTAGLGSVFVATGDLHLKVGGRMALVLPKALLSGVAWEKTRQLFRLRYQLEYLVVSHDPARWNFSENTDLSEALVVARRLVASGTTPPPVTESVVCVNLWKNPSTAVEALSIAHALSRDTPPDVEGGQGALDIMLGDTKFGEAVSVPWAELRDDLWMPPCAFAQSDLLRAAYHLARGIFVLPGVATSTNIPICRLGQLSFLGPDRRDVMDGFRLASGVTNYPSFWGHDAQAVSTIAQEPNHYLSPLHEARSGRPLRKLNDLWPRAGRFLIAERLRLNTQRLAAIRLDTNVLSNVWKSVILCEESGAHEKALILWLNSTPALILSLTHRQETQGAWVEFKQWALRGMPVLNVTALPAAQVGVLVTAYDRLCQQPLLPFPQMAHDPTRRAIDEAIAQTLGLPDFTILRELLAREPVVCLQSLS